MTSILTQKHAFLGANVAQMQRSRPLSRVRSGAICQHGKAAQAGVITRLRILCRFRVFDLLLELSWS